MRPYLDDAVLRVAIALPMAYLAIRYVQVTG